MTQEDVCRFLGLAEQLGVAVWLDGGWAVDAWLGRQTRRHADLDIVVETGPGDRLSAALRSSGYSDVLRDDTSAWNFVLGDVAGRQVDFHVIELDRDGSGIYGPPERSVRFPAESLSGETDLCGRRVRAISPRWLVEFHTGYEPDNDDRADVLALCERFGIPIPGAYLTS